jgi:C4-dicarboxylate-specific signal transduction histidine kinase
MAKSRDGSKREQGRHDAKPVSGTDSQMKKAEPPRTLEARLDELSRANRRLKRKIFDLYTIFEISRNFNAVLDYKTLLDSFIFTCLGQVGVLRGALFLKDGMDAREFRLARAKGSGTLPGPDDSFQDDTRLIGYLSRLNRPVYIADLLQDLTTEREMAVLNHFQGGMVVPLIYKTRLAGLFFLADKIAESAFTQDEIEFISALGNQISVAIENARLYEAEKSANEQLWEAQQQLVQAERLAALGEMSAKVAHEVNNPLGIIKNYLLLMKRSRADSALAQKYADIVSQEIDRIALIVEELHKFRRPSRAEFSTVDIRDVLESTLGLAARQLSGSGIEVERRTTEERLFVTGNADLLRQVFLNLILNAQSAMDRGGRLMVVLERRDQQVFIRFHDTGPGVPGDIVPRLFEPFFTTKGEHGSGLGLSICDGIIKSHKGSITFNSDEGGGCFDLLLPLTEKP